MSRGTSSRTTLFVAGLGSNTRAKDLAYEFERYGRLVRCDIPAPRTGVAGKPMYAFVEFEDARDAEDAYFEMQGRRFEGRDLTIQWARNAPSRNWRYDDDRGPRRDERGGRDDRDRSPRRGGGGRDRSRSPRRRDDRRDDREKSPRDDRRDDRPPRGADRDGDVKMETDREYRDDDRRRGRSPN
ncbi:hypothetical protein HDV00_006180 [Rhizophlyctis rosea]|nr:hypothetical protein HDV00_006180 [Rhizophlyctis rosea]